MNAIYLFIVAGFVVIVDMIKAVAVEIILPAVLVFIIIFGVRLAVHGIRDRAVPRSILGLLLSGTVIIGILSSDFVKGRKIVDENWMIGRTVKQVRQRYSGSKDTDASVYDDIYINGVQYSFCVREIYLWYVTDGMTEEVRYYVITDKNGKITDVKRDDRELKKPLSNYDYWDRW